MTPIDRLITAGERIVKTLLNNEKRLGSTFVEAAFFEEFQAALAACKEEPDTEQMKASFKAYAGSDDLAEAMETKPCRCNETFGGALLCERCGQYHRLGKPCPPAKPSKERQALKAVKDTMHDLLACTDCIWCKTRIKTARDIATEALLSMPDV